MATQPPAPIPDDLRTHAAWLRRLAVSLVGRGALADDVVQDTWTAAITTPPARHESLRPWLAQVLRNFVRARARADLNRTRREQAAAALIDDRLPSSEELLARHEALSLLADEVRRLDEPTRSTILLCYAEDLAPSEIARRQGVPAGTVRSRLKRGIDELRRRLDERSGDDGRAWCLTLGLGASLPVPSAAPPGLAASAAKGALLMSLHTKAGMLLAAIGLLLLGGVSLWRFGGGRPPAGPAIGAATDRDHARAPRAAGSAASGTVAAEGAVAGTVVDGDGTPVENASVIVLAASVPADDARAGKSSPGLLAAARSERAGRFRLAPVPAGSVRITAAAPGFLPAQVDNVTVAAGQTTAGIEVRLTRGGHTLSGRVLDTGGGPIPHARLQIRIDGRWATAAAQPLTLWHGGEDGSYRVTLPPGSHSFVVDADGYAPARTSIQLVGTQSHDFRLHPASVIVGRVVRRGTGLPVAGARVSADRRGFSSTTEADGSGGFKFGELEPGDYVIDAVAGALAGRAMRPVVVGLADRIDGIVVEIDTGRVIAGRVLKRGGAPAAEVQVQLAEAAPFSASTASQRTRRGARTGRDGC